MDDRVSLTRSVFLVGVGLVLIIFHLAAISAVALGHASADDFPVSLSFVDLDSAFTYGLAILGFEKKLRG